MDLELLEPSELRGRRGEKWRKYPADVLPAWVADMDFGLAPPLRAYLQEVVLRSDVGYPLSPAEHGVPDAAAERMRALYDWSVPPERIEVLSDVMQGMHLGLEAFSAPGDAVVTPLPIYPPFIGALKKLGRRAVPLHFVRGSDRFLPDFERLEAELDPSVRVLMSCNPHNPTGRVMTREELEQLAELALRFDAYVLSDEIHADLCFEGQRHIPIASLGPEIAARTVTLTSASKAFNLAGLRCAVAIFGSQQLQERFAAVGAYARGGIGMLGLEATRIAWTECSPWLATLRSYLQENCDHLADFVAARWPEVVFQRPEATYLAWLDFGAYDLPGSAYAFMLERAKVALVPGSAFGATGNRLVRLNFATARPVLNEILERMDRALVGRVYTRSESIASM